MALPVIKPYEVPDATRWAPRRLDFTIDPARAVLLVHDMQRYFVDAFAGAPMPAVIDNIDAIRASCDRAGVPIVLSAQPPRQDPADRGLLTDRWGPGVTSDDDAQIIAELTPRPDDIEITKWRYSAFVRTDLADRMAAWGRDQLIITGIYAHIGCMLTAADAFMRDIQPFLAADAVADFSAPDHLQTISYVNETCGIALSTAEIAKALDRPEA